MKRRLSTTAVVAAAVGLLAGPARGDEPAHPAVPGVLDLKRIKLEIVGAYYVKELKGVNASFKQANEARFRGVVVTVKVTKPAGEALTLNGQDLSLHYRFGTSHDSARCMGVSSFSTANDTDRPMTLLSQGYGGNTTGAATTRAGVVYVDLFFMGIEAETSELHLLVAQPTAAVFKTEGWRP